MGMNENCVVQMSIWTERLEAPIREFTLDAYEVQKLKTNIAGFHFEVRRCLFHFENIIGSTTADYKPGYERLLAHNEKLACQTQDILNSVANGREQGQSHLAKLKLRMKLRAVVLTQMTVEEELYWVYVKMDRAISLVMVEAAKEKNPPPGPRSIPTSPGSAYTAGQVLVADDEIPLLSLPSPIASNR
jgi:hypothetical protein